MVPLSIERERKLDVLDVQLERELSNRLSGMLANDHDRLRGGDVVTRLPLGFIRDSAEIFLDKLFPPRESVAPAHG